MAARKINLVRVTATTVLDTQFTVPLNVDIEVTQIDVCNKTAGAVTFTLKLGGKALYFTISIAASATLSWSASSLGGQMIHAADTIQTQASANSALDVIISGTETVLR
jgi:hypothetical protein